MYDEWIFCTGDALFEYPVVGVNFTWAKVWHPVMSGSGDLLALLTSMVLVND
jgi:hypothetical protein